MGNLGHASVALPQIELGAHNPAVAVVECRLALQIRFRSESDALNQACRTPHSYLR